jgi:hypothetical protein
MPKNIITEPITKKKLDVFIEKKTRVMTSIKKKHVVIIFDECQRFSTIWRDASKNN